MKIKVEKCCKCGKKSTEMAQCIGNGYNKPICKECLLKIMYMWRLE